MVSYTTVYCLASGYDKMESSLASQYLNYLQEI